MLSFTVLICISPFKCACFGYFRSQPHFICANVCVFLSAHFVCVFFSCQIHGMRAHDRLRHRREIKVENMYFRSRSIWKCVRFENHFLFSFHIYTHIEFICRRCDHIVFIWLFFNIVYTCRWFLCTHFLHFYLSSSSALISDLYGKFILFFFFSKCMRFIPKCSPIMHSRPFVVLSLAFHFVGMVAVTATRVPCVSRRPHCVHHVHFFFVSSAVHKLHR